MVMLRGQLHPSGGQYSKGYSPMTGGWVLDFKRNVTHDQH